MRQLTALVVLFIIACKNDQKQIRNTESEVFGISIRDQKIGEGRFEVTLEAIVLENDRFQLYYSDSDYNNFSDDRMAETLVRGDTIPQRITFILDYGVIPKKLRLDTGINYSQKPIVFTSLVIGYGNKQFSFDPEMFAQLFRTNRHADFTLETRSIETKVIDNRYDPHFVSINLEEIVAQLMK